MANARPPRIFEMLARSPYKLTFMPESIQYGLMRGETMPEYVCSLGTKITSGQCPVIATNLRADNDPVVRERLGHAAGDSPYDFMPPPFPECWIEVTYEWEWGFTYSGVHFVPLVDSKYPAWYARVFHYGMKMYCLAATLILSSQPIESPARSGNGRRLLVIPHLMRDDPRTHSVQWSLGVDCMYLFEMLNCRNVTLIDGGFTDDGLTNREKREPGRGHLKYKVLKVTVGKNREYVLGRGGSGESASLPLHLRRGYFAHYSPESPMFGNPDLHGRFWIPSHARGDRKNGEIIKTYEVQAVAPHSPPVV